MLIRQVAALRHIKN